MNGTAARFEDIQVRGRWTRDEPMSKHTSWRCGGAADYFFEPVDRDDLVAFYPFSASLPPLMWLGLGSNMLVRDGRLERTVVSTSRGLNQIRWLAPDLLYAEVGVPCAKLARLCAQADRAGLEFLAGIPGTLGGALAMNAGAHGGEIWDYVAAVDLIGNNGDIDRYEQSSFSPAYRSVSGPGLDFVGAWLSLPDSAEGHGPDRIRAILAERSRTQPTGQASCGSVFVNPAGDFAGRLIEQCGLKGYRLGGAMVSDIHANFIVNCGDATADDVEALINHVRAVVRQRCGVSLETEVRIVGNPPAQSTGVIQ
ncbi:MAG: UDP-N-acetylmuramate dehydrogenase [Gammaproteobacteria bacterium]